MAYAKFKAEVLTPEGQAFAEPIEMLSTVTALGSLAILARHEPLLAILEPTELRLYRSEQEIVRFAQAEGYMQFADNEALLLVEEAIPAEQLDRDVYEAKLSDARAAADAAEEGSERRARALRDARRYEAFLAVASSGSEARA
jgi:F-type H+-transporting ATPase subunit epsilon